MRQNLLSDKAVSQNHHEIQNQQVYQNPSFKTDALQSNFHIPQKYQQQRAKITLKPPTRDTRQSLQISSQSSQANLMEKLNLEKQRLFNRSANNSQNNIRKINNSDNRTNSISSSNSKSRLSANLSAFQMVGFPSYADSEHKYTQSAAKLKQIIGNSGDMFQNQGIQFQFSESPAYRNRQNQTSNMSNNAISTSQEQFAKLRKLEKLNLLQNTKTEKSVEKSVERTAELQHKFNQLQSQYCQKNIPQNMIQQNKKSIHINESELLIKECNEIIRTLHPSFEKIVEFQKNKNPNIKYIKEQLDHYHGNQLIQDRHNLRDGLITTIKKFSNNGKYNQIQKFLIDLVTTFSTVIQAIEGGAHQAIIYIQDSKKQLQQDLESINSEVGRVKKLQLNDKYAYMQNTKQFEQERDILLKTINDLKNQITLKNSIVSESSCVFFYIRENQTKMSNLNVDGLDTNQLKDISNIMQTKLQEMSEKEQKLIKLVLAIKKTGVDIEKIYNEEVLNDDSEMNETIQSQVMSFQKSDLKTLGFNDADNSSNNIFKCKVVNDSDESSFHYDGRNDQDSVMERHKVYQNKNSNIRQKNPNPIKLKLNLSHINQRRKQKPANIFQSVSIGLNQPSIHTTNKSDDLNSSQSNQSSVIFMPLVLDGKSHNPQKVSRLQIDFQNDEPLGFHQVFMQKLDEFSESWRQQAVKDDRRINLN